MDKPTKQAYGELQQAFEFFNRALFGGKLPHCLITMQRKKRTRGYFAPERWANRAGATTDEIAMNPEHFASRSVEETLSTLVHEMVHLWQKVHGKPGRGGYHNKEWAGMMESVGLMPSDTGAPGGKRTGDKVTHYIVQGGPFAQAYDRLLAKGFTISWIDRAGPETPKKPSKSGTRTKYTCDSCGLNAWAKPDVQLVCGLCDVELIPADDG